MSKRKDLPPPNMSSTDPDGVLRSRINLGTTVGTATASTPAHTRPHTGTDRGRASTDTPKRSGGTRPDPDGMRRASIYVAEDAIAALENATDQILELLGKDTPRHVALSALLRAGAAQADTVAQQLAQQRAEELATRLAALQQPPASA